MKVEIINDDDIDIFINPYNMNDIGIYDKEYILKYIKDVLKKVNNRYQLNLSGFYKVKSYFNDKVGMFLNIIKIDDNDFNNDIDYRIILFQNEKFLFETEDYDIIKNIPNKKYYNNMFYVDIDFLDNISILMDRGRVVYGDEVKKILHKSINIK